MTLPPEILQNFRSDLLSVPLPKFRDDCASLCCLIKATENYLRDLSMQKNKIPSVFGQTMRFSRFSHE